MQQLLIFIESSEEAWSTPKKISRLFMNRFSINEQSAFEVSKILKFQKTKEVENFHKFHSVQKNFFHKKKILIWMSLIQDFSILPKWELKI